MGIQNFRGAKKMTCLSGLTLARQCGARTLDILAEMPTWAPPLARQRANYSSARACVAQTRSQTHDSSTATILEHVPA